MYQALYRKYRPKSFTDVVGQNVIVKTLSNSIKNQKINHAYLFAGPRGTGKTSIAKIIAKIINCENLNGVEPCNKCVNCTQINNKQFTDIIEIDAASNNGVDEIREIRNKVNLVPSSGKYKIYIIDEVHMLTTAAFNALLKTLEEPPEYVIFILATTEPYKIPQTILSRCQRYDFKKIDQKSIISRLKNIVSEENIEIDDEALDLIAKISDGGMRDSIGILDQLTAYTNEKITLSDVHEVNGTLSELEIKNFISLIIQKNIKLIFDFLDKCDSEGKNLLKITDQIIEFLKNLLIYSNCSDYFEDQERKKIYEETLKEISEEKIYYYIDNFLETVKNIKAANNIRLVLELSIIKILGNNSIVIENKSAKENIVEEKVNLKTKVEIRTENIKSNQKKEIQLDENIKNKIEEIKKVRINNTLALFNKKNLLEFKKKIDDIKILLMNPDYSSLVSLLLDGEIKAKGENNIIFVYENESLSNYFNSELLDLEKFFFEVYKKEYNLISVCKEEWNKIKKEFNESLKNNKNNYKYIEENFDIKQMLSKKKKEIKSIIEQNELDDIFGDIIQYN